MIQDTAKKYYADKAFFDNDRAFAERHFCEGAEYVIRKACEEFLRFLSTRVDNPNYQLRKEDFSSWVDDFRKAIEE